MSEFCSFQKVGVVCPKLGEVVSVIKSARKHPSIMISGLFSVVLGSIPFPASPPVHIQRERERTGQLSAVVKGLSRHDEKREEGPCDSQHAFAFILALA